MSRKRQKISSSQFRPSQSSSSVQDHSQSHLSQSSLLEFYSNSQDIESDLEDNVNNCIRYIIYRAGSNLPIRKSELHEHVLHGIKGRQFDLIIGQVTAVLKRVRFHHKCQECFFIIFRIVGLWLQFAIMQATQWFKTIFIHCI